MIFNPHQTIPKPLPNLRVMLKSNLCSQVCFIFFIHHLSYSSTFLEKKTHIFICMLTIHYLATKHYLEP